jgi:signal transduction histidine kinase
MTKTNKSGDNAAVRAAAWRVGLLVAAVCAGLVLIGGLLFFGYLWFKARFDAAEPAAHHIVVALDTRDLALAGVVLGLLAIIVAGVAAVVASRRATAPMADALARQRAFVADAGHELRTPLAVLHARVQQVRRMTPQEDSRSSVVGELEQDSRALVDLVTDLLESAEGVAQADVSTDSAPIVEQVVSELGLLAGQRRVTLRTSGTNTRVAMPAAALRRCLVALTDNAVTHTREGGSVEIRTEEDGTQATILVQDHGTGLHGIRPDQLFQRFARGTAAAGSAPMHASHGLGLSLVKDIAIRYGGDVSLAQSSPEGSIFRLQIPEETA